MLTRSIKARCATAAVLVCATPLSLAAVAGASSGMKTTKSARKTVTLLQGQNKTIDVGYPQALKHAGAKYSCTDKVSGPAKSKVKILSRGSALGGSVCRVRAKNTSKVSGLDGTASITVAAKTTY
jgi:hypothetical protein